MSNNNIESFLASADDWEASGGSSGTGGQLPPDDDGKMPEKTPRGLEANSLIIFSVLTGCMTFLAVQNLIDGEPLVVLVKSALFATTAGLVTFFVNRFAVDKGAELAATGLSLIHI